MVGSKLSNVIGNFITILFICFPQGKRQTEDLENILFFIGKGCWEKIIFMTYVKKKVQPKTISEALG